MARDCLACFDGALRVALAGAGTQLERVVRRAVRRPDAGRAAIARASRPRVGRAQCRPYNIDALSRASRADHDAANGRQALQDALRRHGARPPRRGDFRRERAPALLRRGRVLRLGGGRVSRVHRFALLCK